ncbi:hypothetical protein [Sphingomonas mali]|uniref:hypothetical protein n=1 Tax=Sphingomonas mali TaxID=40682 RepID=UPI0008308790|nr:hypothetical protein [Sphingomonas mali]
MRFKMMAAAGLAVLTIPAFAQTGDTAPAPKPKKEKKICRPLEPFPGSHMMRSSCHTKDEWAKIDGTGVDPNAERAPMPGVRSGDGITSGSGASDAH